MPVIGLRALCVLSLVIVCAVAAPAGAQTVSHAFSLGYLPATATLMAGGSAAGGWTSGLWVVDYRLRYTALGLHLQLATGAQRNWSGVWLGASNGRDLLWSADATVSYDLLILQGRASLGYGSLSSTATFGGSTLSVAAHGLRLGLESATPLLPGFSLTHGSFWYLSPQVEFASGGLGVSATGQSLFDGYAGLRFAALGWSVDGGYRWARVQFPDGFAGCGACSLQWSGVFVTTGYRW